MLDVTPENKVSIGFIIQCNVYRSGQILFSTRIHANGGGRERIKAFDFLAVPRLGSGPGRFALQIRSEAVNCKRADKANASEPLLARQCVPKRRHRHLQIYLCRKRSRYNQLEALETDMIFRLIT